MGILYPDVDAYRDTPVQTSIEDHVETDVDAEAGGDAPDNLVDPAVAMSRVRYPRSMGITIALEHTAQASLEISVAATRYEETGEDEWRAVDIAENPLLIRAYPARLERQEVAEGLELVVHSREARGGAIAVTLTLVNTLRAPQGEKDAFSFFRPRITVRPVHATLRERPPATLAGVDELEIRSQQLLFRDVRSFAVGHGCAVAWEGSDPETVRTTYLPRYELLLSEAAGGDGLDLSMTALAEDDSFDVLERLIADYRVWISGLPASAAEALDDEEEATLQLHMREARAASDRMEAGLALLRTDGNVRRAFQLMNLAMAQQRSRQEHHRSGGFGDPDSTAAAAWRPFQIAFILTNLSGLADPDHEDRHIADLLWFPTGGGKTEAYLGIIGIAILLRRLRDPKAAGVSVLMRYTLRLLTLQQYQRATGLICALEMERQAHLPDTAPISIGLWVGKASTPNDVDTAGRALQKARRPGARDADEDASDPVQLRRCPWCGSPLDHNNYEIVDRTWMRVACGRDTCAFRYGLPVHIIDSDVYTNRPSLVIGTVDKFAMMPWKREVGALLGAGGPVADPAYDYLPPDLIVQDELHLISGPLGTMVGLYETAVDGIAGRRAPAKIVASTATIRRASDQVRAVFARTARQFPPPGLSHRDSFFAVQAPRSEKASREYVGAMAPGASQTTLMVRVYASLLQSAAMVPESDPSADLYWTLLGYFNSLRILGGAYIQVLDDVPDQMKVIASRRGETVRNPKAIREMTSRKRSSEIPHELEILERRRGELEAADVVLATNMISVGVDVDRLGLMVVMGQPQTSSEYIQATSRVGRRMPGLVVTVYNSGRSRDLSHYENFAAYHRMLYRHVEATGATPFAPRARDRALHAVLVSLARHLVAGAGASESAGRAAEWADKLEDLADLIVDRSIASRTASDVPADDESPETIRKELSELIDHWADAHVSHYEGWFSKWRGALLIEASRVLSSEDEPQFAFPPAEPAWPTLTSMRDVDAESSVYLIRRKRTRRER
ncbi:MAG: helicase-related protein [Dermatophilaceae bacterium]